MLRFISICLSFFIVSFSIAEEKTPFDPLQNTVGFIKDSKGNKYLVVETKEGAKLINVSKKPEELINNKEKLLQKKLKVEGK